MLGTSLQATSAFCLGLRAHSQPMDLLTTFPCGPHLSLPHAPVLLWPTARLPAVRFPGLSLNPADNRTVVVSKSFRGDVGNPPRMERTLQCSLERGRIVDRVRSFSGQAGSLEATYTVDRVRSSSHHPGSPETVYRDYSHSECQGSSKNGGHCFHSHPQRDRKSFSMNSLLSSPGTPFSHEDGDREHLLTPSLSFRGGEQRGSKRDLLGPSSTSASPSLGTHQDFQLDHLSCLDVAGKGSHLLNDDSGTN